MKTTLRTDLTVADICQGFVYNQLEGKGLFGLGGKLTIGQNLPTSRGSGAAWWIYGSKAHLLSARRYCKGW